jgi:hypothetical protein
VDFSGISTQPTFGGGTAYDFTGNVIDPAAQQGMGGMGQGFGYSTPDDLVTAANGGLLTPTVPTAPIDATASGSVTAAPVHPGYDTAATMAGTGGGLLSGLGGAAQVAVPLLGAAAASQGASQSGTSTTTTDPWAPQQPYLMDLFARGQTAMQGALPMSADETSAYNAMRTRATAGSPLNTQATTNYSDILSGKSMSANPFMNLQNENPYLDATIAGANRQAWEAMNPMFNQQQQRSGSFGNSGVAQMQAGKAADVFGQQTLNARMTDYNNNLNRAQNAYGMETARRDAATQGAGAFAQQDYLDMGQLANVGNTMRMDQFKPLQAYQGLVGGANYGQQQTSPMYQNKAATALGGGLLAAQVYNTLWK